MATVKPLGALNIQPEIPILDRAGKAAKIIPIKTVAVNFKMPQTIRSTALTKDDLIPEQAGTYAGINILSNSFGELRAEGFLLDEPRQRIYSKTETGKQTQFWSEFYTPSDREVLLDGYQKTDYKTYTPTEILHNRRNVLTHLDAQGNQKGYVENTQRVWLKENPADPLQPFIWISGFNRNEVQTWVNARNKSDPSFMLKMGSMFFNKLEISRETLLKSGFSIPADGGSATLNLSDNTRLFWDPNASLSEMQSWERANLHKIEPGRRPAWESLNYMRISQDPNISSQSNQISITELKRSGFKDSEQTTKHNLWHRETGLVDNNNHPLVHIWIPGKNRAEMQLWFDSNKTQLPAGFQLPFFDPSSETFMAYELGRTDSFEQGVQKPGGALSYAPFADKELASSAQAKSSASEAKSESFAKIKSTTASTIITSTQELRTQQPKINLLEQKATSAIAPKAEKFTQTEVAQESKSTQTTKILPPLPMAPNFNPPLLMAPLMPFKREDIKVHPPLSYEVNLAGKALDLNLIQPPPSRSPLLDAPPFYPSAPSLLPNAPFIQPQRPAPLPSAPHMRPYPPAKIQASISVNMPSDPLLNAPPMPIPRRTPLGAFAPVSAISALPTRAYPEPSVQASVSLSIPSSAPASKIEPLAGKLSLPKAPSMPTTSPMPFSSFDPKRPQSALQAAAPISASLSVSIDNRSPLLNAPSIASQRNAATQTKPLKASSTQLQFASAPNSQQAAEAASGAKLKFDQSLEKEVNKAAK